MRKNLTSNVLANMITRQERMLRSLGRFENVPESFLDEYIDRLFEIYSETSKDNVSVSKSIKDGLTLSLEHLVTLKEWTEWNIQHVQELQIEQEWMEQEGFLN